MIKVDESDPIGELEPSFPFKDITIRRGVDMKEHYELQSEIGRGKFGTVFKCREKATGLMLAAKFVGIINKQDRRNVEREVEIMCELQHPRLIQLYDAFEANNAMCFILELIEGGELFERVIGDDFVLTEKAVTIFMRQICEGVQFIHSKKILHLDLKPENILCLTKTGNRIKIIDFGLARKFNPDNKLQVLFGTPEFVAPEVVNFDAIGFGTDMWSVGVICYVLLSGLSPFMGETDVETMANVTIAQYDFDDEAFDSISNDAKDFIKKLLVKDHKSRPTATECLAHRWMQKKKPKKIIARKNSSKKLLKQMEEKPKISTTEPCDQDVLLVPLDVSKENLKELCSKSRSQSPVEFVTVLPNLVQLRIQKDCKSPRKKGNDDEPITVTSDSDKTADVTVLTSSPPSSVDCKMPSDDDEIMQSNSDAKLQISLTSSLQQPMISSTHQSSTSGTHQSTTYNVQQPKTFNVQQTMTSDIQQATISGVQQATTSGTHQSTNPNAQQAMTSGTHESTTSNSQSPTTSDIQLATISDTHQSTNSNAQQVTTSDTHQVITTNAQQSNNFNVQQATTSYVHQSPITNAQQVNSFNSRHATISGIQQAISSTAAVDFPSASVHETTKWSMHQTTTNEDDNNHGRRSSDISYMFSSFRTTCNTTSGTMMQSSNFLRGTDIRGLSERLQDMHLSMFDDRPVVGPEAATEKLHKLLLNRQRLTASSSFDRKPKFKLSALNRDVPAGSPPPASNLLYYMTTTSRSSSSLCRSAPHSERASPEHESSSAYKEMLLKLFYGGGAAATSENPVVAEPKLST